MSGNSDHTLERIEPIRVTIPGEGMLHVTIETSAGRIVARLHEVEVSRTVMNYLALMTGAVTGAPYYDGLQVQRVVPDYLVTFGAPPEERDESLHYATHEEAPDGQTHDRPGLLTQHYMCRDVAGAEISMTASAAPWLDRNHTIFGEIIEGMEVLKALSNAPAASQRPNPPIVIEKITPFRQ